MRDEGSILPRFIKRAGVLGCPRRPLMLQREGLIEQGSGSLGENELTDEMVEPCAVVMSSAGHDRLSAPSRRPARCRAARSCERSEKSPVILTMSGTSAPDQARRTFGTSICLTQPVDHSTRIPSLRCAMS